MITTRYADERFHTRIDWLDSRHSFSFGHHHDPRHMGFRSLRVINEDVVAPGQGFGTHPHRDMEILTYVVEGAVAHRDSMGNGAVVRPGEVQRMTAGTGVLHSEVNPSSDTPLHLLQIWIQPEARGLEPSYEQREFPASERSGRLRLVASRNGRDGSITVHQDASLYAATLATGERVTHELATGRHAWVQVIRGAVEIGQPDAGDGTTDDVVLAAGDGAAVSDASTLNLVAREDAELLLFDLA